MKAAVTETTRKYILQAVITPVLNLM